MPTPMQQLTTRRDTILSELAALILKKPDYSLDSQSVQWTAYRKSLYDELESINELINLYDPFEIQTISV